MNKTVTIELTKDEHRLLKAAPELLNTCELIHKYYAHLLPAVFAKKLSKAIQRAKPKAPHDGGNK